MVVATTIGFIIWLKVWSLYYYIRIKHLESEFERFLLEVEELIDEKPRL